MLLAFPLLLAATPLPADVPKDDPAKNADADKPKDAIPPAIKAMLDAAIRNGNEGEVATIVKYARAADPASGDAVQQIAQKWRDDRAAQHNEQLAHAALFDLWKGKAELGGYLTTGNSDTKGLSGSLDITREGLKWRDKLRLQADYQESLGITTREHYLAAFEPNYKVSNRAYIYGSAQYESDRFLGYDDRYSTSVGAGYSAFKSRAVKLDLELGPAFRQTAFTDDTTEGSIAARGSLDFAWKLTPALSVTQAASAYVERFNSTVSGTTALNAKLIGPLSAQLSYNVQYESMPPAGSVSTDTTSRAALVYSF